MSFWPQSQSSFDQYGRPINQPVQQWPITQQQLQQQQLPEIPTKLFLPKDEVRRVMVPQNQNYEQIKNFVQPFLKETNRTRKQFLEYFFEGDWVRFDTEKEWNECLTSAKKVQPFQLKLRVKVKKPKAVAPAPEVRQIIPEPINIPVEPVQPPTVEPIQPPVVPCVPMVQQAQEPAEDPSIEELRKTHQNLRQSIHSFIQNSPQKAVEEPKPTVDALPQPMYPQTEEKKEEPSKYEALLVQLADMGFDNKEQNIELLDKHNGNVLEVIQHYLK
jgi:hypothetical protein